MSERDKMLCRLAGKEKEFSVSDDDAASLVGRSSNTSTFL